MKDGPQATKRTPDAERRDPRVHQAILDAAVKRLEQDGYKRLTIEAIAAEAGVGKQTIYRWWPGKAALVMEAYAMAAEVRAPEPDTGNVVDDLQAILLPVFRQNEHYDRGVARVVKSLMAEAQLDPSFLQTFHHLTDSWHAPLRNVLERAKDRGELRADADSDALIDIMLGASWHRVLLEHAPLDARFAHEIVKTIVDGNRPADAGDTGA